MTHGSLFSGEGGFDLAAEWIGWGNKFHCEIDEFCNNILNYYWPNADKYKDIKETDFTFWRGRIDVLSGGFPCQGFSNSGRKLGESDERYLFPEMLRAIREIRPRWVVAENVYALASSKFSKVFQFICTSLEGEGYKVQPIIIPASAVGAEHERNRVWFIAHANSIGLSRQGNVLGQMQPTKIGDRETSRFVNFIQRNAMPFVCESHYGFSRGLAEQAIHAAGNAIVPQLAYQIFKTINQYEQQIKNGGTI